MFAHAHALGEFVDHLRIRPGLARRLDTLGLGANVTQPCRPVRDRVVLEREISTGMPISTALMTISELSRPMSSTW